jgi:hypothetical protein
MKKQKFPIIVRHYSDRWNIDGRWDIYKDNGVIYDTKKAEDIPQWVFEFRDKIMKKIKEEILGSQEINTCAFCRTDKPVLRAYLHAKNKPAVGDGFDFIYYCAECGLKENVLREGELEQEIDLAIKAERKRLREEIKRLKREIGQDIISATDVALENYKAGYNYAISEILSLLKEDKNEKGG